MVQLISTMLFAFSIIVLKSYNKSKQNTTHIYFLLMNNMYLSLLRKLAARFQIRSCFLTINQKTSCSQTKYKTLQLQHFKTMSSYLDRTQLAHYNFTTILEMKYLKLIWKEYSMFENLLGLRIKGVCTSLLRFKQLWEWLVSKKCLTRHIPMQIRLIDK